MQCVTLPVSSATVTVVLHVVIFTVCSSGCDINRYILASYGRIILIWIFREWEGVVGTGWSGLRIGTGGGHLWVR
jgi:hypothetical protein